MHCSTPTFSLRATNAPRTLSSAYLRQNFCLIRPKLQIIVTKRRTLSMSYCLNDVGDSESPIEKMDQSNSGEKDAVIIVDHGSRREESNLMLNEFVTMFKAKSNDSIIEPAHMELAKPSIRDAFAKCVQQGAKRIIVSSFFLLPGRHWQQDIPALVAEASKEHEGISYLITAPLGLHELLVDVMNDRINHCLRRVNGLASECDVCAGTGKCRLYS